MLLHPLQRRQLIPQSEVRRIIRERFRTIEPAVDVQSVVGHDEDDGRAHELRLGDDGCAVVDGVGAVDEAAAEDWEGRVSVRVFWLQISG